MLTRLRERITIRLFIQFLGVTNETHNIYHAFFFVFKHKRFGE